MKVCATECPIHGSYWGAVLVGLADGFLLLWTITFMGSALVPAFARHYWLLGLLLSLVSFGLVVVLLFAVLAARENYLESGRSGIPLLGVATYLLVPLIVSAVASVFAWGITVVISGSLY